MDLMDEALRDHVRLQLPMHIAERYGAQPAGIHNTSAADSRTRLHIRVDVQTSDIIHGIRSPTHHVVTRHHKGRSGRVSQRRISVVWESPGFLNSDFVITIHAEGLDKPRCFAEVLHARELETQEGSTVAMQLTLVPKFLAPKIPSQEYIFVIDRSGSMSGNSIETAKKTLIMLLRLLPNAQTTFNIFSFGSHVDSMWHNSHALDRASLDEAVRCLLPEYRCLRFWLQTSHVEGMNADYGGTEIPMALQSAFSSRRLDRPAVLFLLTDGQIHVRFRAHTPLRLRTVSFQGNEELNPWAVISNAIQNSPSRAPVRLFVLGIGRGVSSDVCSSLARQGNGEYLFALAAEDIFGKCALLLNAGRSKNIESINIDWGHEALSPTAIGASSATTPSLPASIPALLPPASVQQAPHSLTNIFSEFRFTVFVITSFRTIPASVRLITKLDGIAQPQELIVDVKKVKPFRDTNEHSIIPIVHTLAARKLIMELVDGVGPLPTPAPGDALLVSEDDLRRAGIVRLGLNYQLVSKYTSFVAVQNRGERRRNGGHGSRSTAWARSRLRQPNPDVQQDSSMEATTFFDDLLDGVSSFITSIFGFLSNPATLPSTTNPMFNPRSHNRPEFPGAYDESESGTSENRGRTPRRASSSPQRRSPSRSSIATFSSLSSLEGSSCSSCWTSSRSPSPLPRFRDPIDRAPSPELIRDTGAPAPGTINAGPSASRGSTSNRAPIPQEVYDLFQQMDVDGSITVTPLLTRLVGDAVLSKADELRIDRQVWATVVAVAYIRGRLQGEPDLLELLSEKAKEFVDASEWSRRDGAKRFEEMVREAVALLNP